MRSLCNINTLTISFSCSTFNKITRMQHLKCLMCYKGKTSWLRLATDNTLKKDSDPKEKRLL